MRGDLLQKQRYTKNNPGTDIDSAAFELYDIYQIYREVTNHAYF